MALSFGIVQYLLPISAARSGKKLRAFSGVTIHETANTRKGADAKAHAVYMNVNGGKNSQISSHYYVDEKLAYACVPENEVAWHAGDGANGKGNNETVCIEMCVNADGNYIKTVENSAELAADILVRNGIKSAAAYVYPHKHFSSFSKNCPARLLGEGKFDEFIATVQKYIDRATGAAQQAQNSEEGVKPTQLFRVLAGTYKTRLLAVQALTKLALKGYKSFIGFEQGSYYVQLGAFAAKANADGLVAQVKKLGYKNAATKM